MRKNSILTRLVSLTVVFAMVMTIGGSVFAAKKGDITLGTAITVNVKNNSTDWYTFTPTHTGEYTLTARRLSNAQSTGTIATSTNTTSANPTWTNVLDNIGSSDASKTLNLIAGTTYGFRVRHGSNSGRQYTFTLSANFATISFNGNGSTSTMDSVYPTLNQAYTLPACTMTRDDYEFAGWATSATGDVVYADQASITPTADMTLYAKWNENREIEVTATGYDGPYDGNYHTIDVNVTTPESGYTINYGTTEGAYPMSAPPEYLTGDHTIYYEVTAEGYPAATGSADINISNLDISATIAGYTGVYDGDPHGITVTVTTPSTGYTIEYRETATGEWSGTAPTYTTGTHTVYYRVTAEGYAEVTGSENVVISEATISYTASNYNAGYDGQPHSIIVNVTEPATGYTIEYSSSQYGPWSTTAPTVTNPNTSARRVYFRISAPGYATTAVDSRTIRVTTGTIDYTAEGYTGAYDGQAHGISITVNAPASGYTIEYRTSQYGNWTTTAPTRSDTGTTTVYYRITATNYTTVTGNRTITISNGTIDYNAEGYTGTYDGSAHSISVSVTTPATGATIQYREAGTTTWRNTNPSFSAAGTHNVEYRIRANNYAEVTGSATVTINPAQMVYSASGYTGTYDGSTHRISVSVTTPATGVQIRYRAQGSTNWSTNNPGYAAQGTYVVEYRIRANNYAEVTGSATITINPADMTVTATGHEGTWDGASYGITVSVTKPATGATIRYGTTEGTYNLTTSPVYSDAGEHTVYYQVTAANYNAFTGSATVTISNATMTVEATGYSAPYDGEAHGIEVNVITPASGATVLYGESADACTLTTCPTYSYGEHTVYFVVSADNYNDYTGSATVSISDIDIVATAEGYDGPYDGEEHGITITVTDPASGATVMYGTEEGSYDYEISPVFTQIGDYTVYYQVTAEGHNPLTGSATVRIGELTIDATVTPYDGVFDGAEHGVTVTVNTPEVGATVLFGTEAGVYDLDESPTYCEIGTYTVYYRISAEYYAPLEGSVVVRISENPDRDNAREALIELIAASDEILDEWEDLIPEDLVDALLDAEDAAYEVLNNEIASIEQLEAAADNLANALGNVLQYIAENYETEPELTPEQRTRLCVINFVENLYLHALGRPFDVSGRDTWVSLIMDQGGTGTQVARGFLGSQEFLGLGLDNEGFVKALYNALFNRVPEAEEVDTWTNALAAGVTREEVINAFFASPEWARTCAYYRVNI